MIILTAEDAEVAETVKNSNELTEAIIGAAMEVHRALGPGLLELTYEMCLCRELSIRRNSLRTAGPDPGGIQRSQARLRISS